MGCELRRGDTDGVGACSLCRTLDALQKTIWVPRFESQTLGSAERSKEKALPVFPSDRDSHKPGRNAFVVGR
jgi:hypothetical protein